MSELRIVDTVTVYVVTGEPWMTPDQVEDLCCESISMPDCEEKTEDWSGFNAQEMLEKLGIALDKQGRDGNGNYVDIRLIVPPGGVCGEKITKIAKKQRNCCDGVTPLEWDEDSVSIISPAGSGIVIINGGSLPFAVSVRGAGFYLDENHEIRDAEIGGSNFKIYTDATACGSATVSVSDGCTDVSNVIRCTVGQWVARDPVSCEEAGLGVVDADDLTGGYTMTVTVVIGAFKYSQGWSMEGSSPIPENCVAPDISGCGTTIVPFPQRSRCQSTYGGPQSVPSWFAINENSPAVGNNISCGWGTYEGRCETIGVEEWVC